MNITGVKMVCEQKNGDINTWHDVLVLEPNIESIINRVKYQKNWMGGKFLNIYIEFESNNKYNKIELDIKKNKYNELLK